MKLKHVFSITATMMVLLTAGCKKDVNFNETAPVVKSTDPVNIATGSSINSRVSATFSWFMDASTINAANFTLKQGADFVPGTVAYAGVTGTFTPTNKLKANTIYSATITSNVRDQNGKPMEKNYTWSFTTGNTTGDTSPTVISTVPGNAGTGVSFGQPITATFSKAMNPATITSLTFTLHQGTSAITGAVTYTGTTATFTPAVNLKPNTTYTGTITTGVKDMAGNPMAAVHTFSFTTGDGPAIVLPVISSTDPIDNAQNIALNKAVAVTFSVAMNPLTLNASTFTLKNGTVAVNGNLTFSGKTALFTPTNFLTAGTVYTAMVTTGVKDLAGNALATSKQWSFTTKAATTSTLAAVNLLTAANYVILAKTAINNNPISSITGDLGLSPAATSYITGFSLTNATGYATSAQVTGQIFAADMVSPTSINLTTAVNDMNTAYVDAAGRPTPDFSELGTGNIGGKILIPGLYKWTSSVTMPSDVTISGGANDVWIFQISGDLSMSNGVRITLAGGAQAKNIFWQVAGQATIGTTAHFEGIILSKTGITLKTGASMNGRALAQTAVILDGNAVTKP